MKREGYISWDEYFMGVAGLSSLRSKDPAKQIWACIVNDKKRIIGIWYNGFPKWCSDDEYPWHKGEDFLDNKHAYVVHAEANAILNSNRNNLQGATIYVLLFPCHECAKLIIQSWIKKVVYLSDEKGERHDTKAAKRMFKSAGVETEWFIPTNKQLTINF